MKITDSELQEHLNEHISFIQSSVAAFDAGFDGEAKRLAVSARVLLHDTPASHSLLGQLGLLNKQFYGTASPRSDRDVLPYHGLLQVGFNGGQPTYRVPLDDRPPPFLRWIAFADWWSEVVFDDRAGGVFSRRGLVLALANKDGGAHVDPKLYQSYARLAKGNAMGWQVDTPEGPQPISGRVERLAMRQLAHEILSTLDRLRFAA